MFAAHSTQALPNADLLKQQRRPAQQMLVLLSIKLLGIRATLDRQAQKTSASCWV